MNALDSGPSPRLQVKVPRAMAQNVIAYANAHGITVSEYLRRLLAREGHDTAPPQQ